MPIPQSDNMGDVNLKQKTGLQWRKPMFVDKKKRSSQSLSSEKDSDSDVVHVNIRARKHESQFGTRKLQDYPNEAQTTIKEWNALYTTQLTQKTKKYHDGVLRLIFASHTNQVILLNEDGSKLSSKYLKSIDHIETGHECELPNYLIQICESRTLPRDNCLSGGSLDQVAGCRNLKMELSTSIGRVTDIKSIPNDIQNRHSGQVDCGSSDEARSMDISLKSAQEWTALYTTQKTQKAKKFHDGIFQLVNRGSHMKQIVLLNEEGEVLNSRYLKSTESVETGCFYEFPNYLVEVCESKAPIRDNNPGGSVEKNAPCTASKVDRSMYSHRVTGSKSMLNAYVKIDHLEQDVEVSDNTECNDNNTKSINEWTALYTTQKTQKAKKYHDGVLRLVSCGSHMKQIVLLNEEGDILSSRYLMSTELVELGRSYEFPNYLVEVSESKVPTGEQAVHGVSDKAEANNKNIKSTHDIKKEDSGKATNNFSNDNITLHNITDKPMLEWDVMYTTQMTQKAKRYHDGVLQITHHRSQMKQAILLNEDGAVLSSKYFKSAGCIKSGHKFEFPNYLIEICEPRAPGRDVKTAGGLPKKHLEQVADCTSSNTEVLSTPISIYDQKDSNITDSNMEGSTSVNNRQIRDANQILSFLRKPVQPQTSDSIVLDADNTYKIPDISVMEPKEVIPEGNAIETHDGHNLQPQSKHGTDSLNQLSGKLSLEPQLIKQDMCYDYTKNEHLARSSTAPEVSYDHIHSSPKYVQKILSEDSLPSSSSPPEEDIGSDKSRSLSDEIMNLQQEWTTLSHRASTFGNTHNYNSSLQNDIPVDENYVADLPSCNKSESMHAELKSISNVNDFPSFDLGFN